MFNSRRVIPRDTTVGSERLVPIWYNSGRALLVGMVITSRGSSVIIRRRVRVNANGVDGTFCGALIVCGVLRPEIGAAEICLSNLTRAEFWLYGRLVT